MRCDVYFVLMWCGVAERVCARISYPSTCVLMRRSVADVARCYNDALSELARRSAAVGCVVCVRFSGCVSLCGAFCGAFCAGYFRWKDSISGRTGLDLGRVCGVRRGLNPEVCCVVLCYSLLALLSGGAVEVRIVFCLSVQKILG